MGSGTSKVNNSVLENKYKLRAKEDKVKAALDAIQVTDTSVGLQFYDLFCKIDADGSESIDLNEFHTYFGVKVTPFSTQVFSCLGMSSKGREITFDDFVLNIWNYSTMDNDDIKQFIFCLYDEDSGGTLDQAECESLLRMLYNVAKLDYDMKRRLKKADVTGTGELNYQEFCAFTTKEKRFLAPAFDLQSAIRNRSTFSKDFWIKETKRRKAMHLQGLEGLFHRHQTNVNLLEAKSVVQKPKIQQTAAAEPIVQDTTLEDWSKARTEPIEVEFFNKFISKVKIEQEIRYKKDDVAHVAKLRVEFAKSKHAFEQAEKALLGFWKDQEALDIGKAEKEMASQAEREAQTPVMKKQFTQDAKRIIDKAKAMCAKPYPTKKQAYEQAVVNYRETLAKDATTAVRESYERYPELLKRRMKELEGQSGWRKVYDEVSGHYYYESLSNGETTWEKPVDYNCS